uniref:Uncharacterized protein n=2 Tax=Oryza TaxID=4527 RepID=A0A0D3FD83_9ORYZ
MVAGKGWRNQEKRGRRRSRSRRRHGELRGGDGELPGRLAVLQPAKLQPGRPRRPLRAALECRTSHLHCNTQDGSTSRSSDNNRPQEHPVEAFLSKIRGKVEAKESCTRQPDPTEQRQTTKRPSL